MKVSDIVVDFLVKNGVDTVFGYPGGNITHILDSLHRNGKIRYLQGYQEQACAFAADGYSRMTGKISVAFSSSGPGATNMATAVADAWLDSVPCVFLCGQVSMHDQSKDERLRQNGFQEVDIVSQVRSITKYAKRVIEAEKILYHLEKAVHYAICGRKGPVLLELPHSIQAAEVEEEALVHYQSGGKGRAIESDSLHIGICEAIKLIEKSKKPLIFVGNGVRHAGCALQIKKYASDHHIPIVTSMMAIDQFGKEDKEVLGFVGPCGYPKANYAVSHCDVLIALGVRLEGQHVGRQEEFAPSAKIIHVDIDAAELDNFSHSQVRIEDDANHVIQHWQRMESPPYDILKERNGWIGEIQALHGYFGNVSKKKQENKVDPNIFLKGVDDILNGGAVVCADVGQCLLWAAESFHFNEGGRFLASGGLGSMGFALPACIGAYFARPDIVPVVIAGDGGIQMNIQELQTIFKYKIPMKIIVLNNHGLGMVRAYQEQWFKHQFGSVEGYLPEANFKRIADAYGISYMKVESMEAFGNVGKALTDSSAWFFEVMIPEDSVVCSGTEEADGK